MPDRPPRPPRPPVVAVTATIRAEADTRRIRLNAAYTTAVERAGALPIVIPPLSSIAEAARLLAGADALLLTGGEDVEPARYGAAPHPKTEPPSPERDATEIALLEAARARALPTLAICRGIQVLNVAFGGSLIQDIPSERPSAVDHDPQGARNDRVHEVEIEPGSRLAEALGGSHLRVNSFHHQAVDRVAEGLRATAWSPDGIIEGVEWDGAAWWAVGVQWHPEELDGADAGLFAALVRAASSPTSTAPHRAPAA